VGMRPQMNMKYTHCQETMLSASCSPSGDHNCLQPYLPLYGQSDLNHQDQTALCGCLQANLCPHRDLHHCASSTKVCKACTRPCSYPAPFFMHLAHNARAYTRHVAAGDASNATFTMAWFVFDTCRQCAQLWH
jgi:hypothetical protein